MKVLFLHEPSNHDFQAVFKDFFNSHEEYNNLLPNDYDFLSCYPTVKKKLKTEQERALFYKENRDSLWAKIEALEPDILVPLGERALSSLFSRKLNFEKVRGHVLPLPINSKQFKVISLDSPLSILKDKEIIPFIVSGFNYLKSYTEGNLEQTKDYKQVTDLSFILNNINDYPLLAVDTETTGLIYRNPNHYPFLVQLTPKEGVSYLIPVHEHYWSHLERDHNLLISQLKEVLENPEIKKVGHNFKFDYNMLKKLGIHVKGWEHDTQLMVRYINENIKRKSLDECVKLYVPEMFGFNDQHQRGMNKSKMIEVEEELIVQYAGGDSDATYRLYQRLLPELLAMPSHYKIYNELSLPAVKAVADSLEVTGMPIQRQALVSVSKDTSALLKEAEKELLSNAPVEIIKKFLAQGLVPDLDKPSVIADCFYHPLGFKFEANKTKTGKLSVNKQFLESVAGDNEFASSLLKVNSLKKLISTYTGIQDPEDEDSGTGMLELIQGDCGVYPTYNKDTTVTDRWSSSSPSGQTIPKRGKEATLFRSTIKAPAGYKIVEVDWSQLELRLTAWLNNVPMMLESYAKDIDLHALTAFKNLATQSSNPVSDFIKKNGYNGAFEYFCSLEKSNDNHLKDFYESNRFKAKATNFGLIYKISLNGYLSMAKFQYKRHDLTKEEASKEYQNFFKTYPELITAFNLIEKELLKTKKVKNAFGLYRHLPNIDSKDFSTRNKTFREAVNFVIQSIGGELASIGIVQLHRLKLLNPRLNNLFFMIGFIHDAFVFVVHESVLDTCLSAISHILENLPIKHLFNIECPVPLKVDIKTGDDFNTKTQWSINPYKRFKNLKGVNIPDGDLKSVMEATEPLCEYLW